MHGKVLQTPSWDGFPNTWAGGGEGLSGLRPQPSPTASRPSLTAHEALQPLLRYEGCLAFCLIFTIFSLKCLPRTKRNGPACLMIQALFFNFGNKMHMYIYKEMSRGCPLTCYRRSLPVTFIKGDLYCLQCTYLNCLKFFKNYVHILFSKKQ